jgi:hypothetical protein
VGGIGGESHGTKALFQGKYKGKKWNHLRVDIHPSGQVVVFLNNETSPSLSYNFIEPVSGGVGYRTRKTGALFDNFVAYPHPQAAL